MKPRFWKFSPLFWKKSGEYVPFLFLLAFVQSNQILFYWVIWFFWILLIHLQIFDSIIIWYHKQHKRTLILLGSLCFLDIQCWIKNIDMYKLIAVLWKLCEYKSCKYCFYNTFTHLCFCILIPQITADSYYCEKNLRYILKTLFKSFFFNRYYDPFCSNDFEKVTIKNLSSWCIHHERTLNNEKVNDHNIIIKALSFSISMFNSILFLKTSFFFLKFLEKNSSNIIWLQYLMMWNYFFLTSHYGMGDIYAIYRVILWPLHIF